MIEFKDKDVQEEYDILLHEEDTLSEELEEVQRKISAILNNPANERE